MQIINKKDIPEELVVKIEKLSNLGFGIAKVDGYVLFVENACPEDVLKVKVGKKNKNYAYAKIIEILEPSPHRISSICSMQKVCGACQLQFIDYNYQLILKKEIVSDAIKNIAGFDIPIRDVVPSPKNLSYRCKVQYPISETKESKRIIAGYYKTGTHDLINIKHCPIQPTVCDEIVEYIRNVSKECGISGYKESSHKGDLRHVVIRTSEYNNTCLVVLVVNATKTFDKLNKLANLIYTNFENVTGVCVNFNSQKTNLILGKETQLLEGENYIEECLCDKIFKIGAETFFQINPSSANNIFKYVKEYVSNNFDKPLVLDAYAGITTFGICLADISKKVVSVEEVKASVQLADKIIKENGIKNIELHNMDAGKFFQKEIKTKGRLFDVSIIDPPRKGCSKESLDYLLKLTKDKIIYVSCNPATLARDLKYLKDNNCTVEYIQPFDMFPHTYHIENVAIIKMGKRVKG
jgi:23S rRNA (uracil1939-C5)-methyltransferase